MWFSSRLEKDSLLGFRLPFSQMRRQPLAPLNPPIPLGLQTSSSSMDPCFLAKPHLHLYTAGHIGHSKQGASYSTFLSQISSSPVTSPASRRNTPSPWLGLHLHFHPRCFLPRLGPPLHLPPPPHYSLSQTPRPLKPTALSKPQSPLPLSATQILLEPETFKTNHLHNICPWKCPTGTSGSIRPQMEFTASLTPNTHLLLRSTLCCAPG